jgi:hypothetical protein
MMTGSMKKNQMGYSCKAARRRSKVLCQEAGEVAPDKSESLPPLFIFFYPPVMTSGGFSSLDP